MQNNSKKSMVKEIRKVRVRFSAIKGCTGVNQSRNLNKIAVNWFSRLTNLSLFVDNRVSFMICPLCLKFISYRLFPSRIILPSILNNTVSKYFSRWLAEHTQFSSHHKGETGAEVLW